MAKLACFPPSAFSLRSNFPKLVFGHLHLCGFPSFASINKQFKAKILGPMGSRKKKSRLLTRGLISLRAFCPMINVLGTLGFTTICRQNFLKSLKKKVFFWATRIELKSSRLAFVDKDQSRQQQIIISFPAAFPLPTSSSLEVISTRFFSRAFLPDAALLKNLQRVSYPFFIIVEFTGVKNGLRRWHLLPSFLDF